MPLPGRKNNFQSTNLISPLSKDVKFMGRNVAEYVFMFLLMGAVGLVFYDISTSMTDQGIARGDAYQMLLLTQQHFDPSDNLCWFINFPKCVH